ncbi:hypothetical protein CL6EHI_178830 [Entamoeba histolytica]|nr:hypothetical protein CL6EHI_178830 [Entamoeba histolytica]
MSRERFIRQFEEKSKLGVMKKRIIGTAEIKQIIAMEFLDNYNQINKFNVDEMVRCFKNKSSHITKRIFVEMMQYLDIYVHRWGKLSEEVVTFMMFKGLDEHCIGEITKNGIPTNLTTFLIQTFDTLEHTSMQQKVNEIIYKLKPQYYGKIYNQYDSLKLGLTTSRVKKILIDIFQIDKVIVPSLVMLLNVLVKDNIISSSDFIKICTSIEWVVERTQHFTILELFTTIFNVLDKDYKGTVPIDRIKIFLTKTLNGKANLISTSPDIQLVEFLHYAEIISDNILDFKNFCEHIVVPMVDLHSLPPLQIAQTKKVTPLLPSSYQNKEKYLKELFTKLEIETSLCDRILRLINAEEKTPDLINMIAQTFDENIRKYGHNEGLVRAVFFTFQHHGIDADILVETSKIFNSPIDLSTAQTVIKAYVEDGTNKLSLYNFVRYWLDGDSPCLDDTDNEKESKLLKRTISMFRVLNVNGFVSKQSIIHFIQQQYGTLSYEELMSIDIIINYLSSFKGELTFDQFQLFMIVYERSLNPDTLSLALTIESICNAIWNSNQFAVIPSLFNITTNNVKQFETYCKNQNITPTPKSFTMFILPILQKGYK